MARPLVRVVFALLVLATIGAFALTQQLKSEFPLIIRFATEPAQFSPNRDHYRDSTVVGFDLSEPAEVSFSVTDGEGNEVRRIVDERRLAGDTKHRFRWTGRDDEGRFVPDGVYRMRVVRADESRVINSIKEITVDTEPPRVELVEATPSVIATGEPGRTPRVRIRYEGPVNAAPEFRVFRTDDGPPRVVRRFRGDDTRSGIWRGEVAAGPDATRPADDGIYAFTVTVRDRAGNLAVAPVEIPTARVARAGTGVSVRGLTLRGPLAAAPAGSLVKLEVGPLVRSFDFALSRLGSPAHVIRRGTRTGGPFRLRIPRAARTGLYLVRMRSNGRRAVWPLPVAGLPQRPNATGRPRPLVVLSAMTWQGLNPVDDDDDGFADTLPAGGPVALDRYLASGGPPPRFSSEVAPLLRYLDRARLRYELTTDVALARGEGPALGNAAGVAFAGSALWLPRRLQRRLHDYVAGGGRVASFGADAFRRTATLGESWLSRPSRRLPRDAFGERTELLRTSPAPLKVLQDGLGLFEGLPSAIGEFTLVELSRGLPDDARRLAAAGRGTGAPALIVFELGDGIVIRSGTPQWARELQESRLGVAVRQVTRRIWRILSSGGGG
jgi:N,N-dimethylformamidase beta subunit-like protein/flagellar hook capping protein FlgD